MTLPLEQCVIDASVGVKLFLPEQHSDEAQRFMTGMLEDPSRTLYIPDLFFVECANVLWKAVTRYAYPVKTAKSNLALLRVLGLVSTPTERLAERALEIGCAHALTAYDACYVALSERLNVPLVTADDRLAAKLRDSAFAIVTLSHFGELNK